MEQEIKWRLVSLEVSFKKGYGFDNSVDRYEGKIKFENDEGDSFQFKIRPNMADAYIRLIAGEIVSSADTLGKKLIESLPLK